MSEQLSNTSPEHKLGAIDVSAEVKRNLERLQEQAEGQAENSPKSIEQLRQQIEKQSVAGHEVTVGERQSPPPSPMLQKDLKNLSYKHTLQQIQHQLPVVERLFSRVIHRPAIEKSSELIGKTAARPSGILTGGIMAFLGSSTLLYMSRHYGFEYNYFVFLALFLGGFVLGIGLEGLIRLIRKKED